MSPMTLDRVIAPIIGAGRPEVQPRGKPVVVSILMRRTAIASREEWQRRIAQALPRVRAVLDKQPGFVDVSYAWSCDDSGEMAVITRWRGQDACQTFVRGGGAALMATVEDAIIPTAAYPHGTWVRKTYEVDE